MFSNTRKKLRPQNNYTFIRKEKSISFSALPSFFARLHSLSLSFCLLLVNALKKSLKFREIVKNRYSERHSSLWILTIQWEKSLFVKVIKASALLFASRIQIKSRKIKCLTVEWIKWKRSEIITKWRKKRKNKLNNSLIITI